MAKVEGPLHSSEARGRVGSLVYNTWRGINYVKTHTNPLTENSAAQVALRLLAANATTSWQAQTDYTRRLWYAYANERPETSCTGQRTRLTAYNWYVRINVRRQLVGGAVLATPPTLTLRHLITNLHYETDPLIIYVEWNWPAAFTPATLYYELYRVGPHSAGAYPSVRMATRRGYSTFISQYYEDAIPAAGWYTYFVRPAHSTGLVTMFQAIRCLGVA